MPDVFTKRKRSEVMSRIRGKGNRDTEVALMKLLRANGIRGWRRQRVVRLSVKRKAGLPTPTPPRRGTGGEYDRKRDARATKIAVDFIFRRERVVVFVDGCFWHGCPVHSSPRKWLRKSSMGKAEERATNSHEWARRKSGARGAIALPTARTGKAFWARKLAGNMARDRFVNRALRKGGRKVVRLWEHDLAKDSGRCVEQVRRALA
jgi:DNA mismatch endonuclease (patch repair protein)